MMLIYIEEILMNIYLYTSMYTQTVNVTRVNDTIIGDPLYTVPLRVTNLEEVGLEEDLSLCYEVHGEPGRYIFMHRLGHAGQQKLN